MEHVPHLAASERRTQCRPHIPPLLSLHEEQGVAKQFIQIIVHKMSVIRKMVKLLHGESLDDLWFVEQKYWRPHIKHSDDSIFWLE